LAFAPPARRHHAARDAELRVVRAQAVRTEACSAGGMTLPRRVVPAATYSLTRRCQDRRFYLKPGLDLNQIFLYALAAAQAKHGVFVHAFACMSNHSHENITDVHGVLPNFMRDLRREIGLAAKTLYRIPYNFWSAEKPTAVELHGEKAEQEQILYTLLNPVRAGLVGHASEWPGAISLPGVREIEVRRPDGWFAADRPEVLTLKITPPPSWTGTEDQWHEWLATELAEREEVIRRARVKKGVLGKERVLQQHPFDRPGNADELLPSRNPAVATGGDAGLMRSVIHALREWRRAYREALERWRGDKTASFPFGTWWVVQRAGAAIA
jgi:putative transposase